MICACTCLKENNIFSYCILLRLISVPAHIFFVSPQNQMVFFPFFSLENIKISGIYLFSHCGYQ